MASEEVEISPTDIFLDPQNPRLNATDRGKAEDELLNIMARRYKLDELGAAISQVGYIDRDPLIGYRDNGRVYVREGNRRIATLKLLLEPERAPRSKRGVWRDLANALDEAKRRSFSTVRITVYDDISEVDIDAYVGFRHVSGVLEWPPLEKARFIADLIDRHGWSYKYISDLLGSRPRYVERNFVAFKIIQQSSDLEIDGADNISFGTLTRALQAGGISEFLGLQYTGDPKDNISPIPDEKIECLADFIELLFGTGDRDPIVKDSRQITKLAHILRSEDAIRYAKSATNPSIERAWQKAGGQQATIVETLETVADNLEDIAAVIVDYTDDEDVRKALERSWKRLKFIVTSFEID